MVWLCRLGTMVGGSDSETYLFRQRHQIMFVNMLQNWNDMYSSYYRIIKYVGFESIIYAINLDVVSFF